MRRNENLAKVIELSNRGMKPSQANYIGAELHEINRNLDIQYNVFTKGIGDLHSEIDERFAMVDKKFELMIKELKEIKEKL